MIEEGQEYTTPIYDEDGNLIEVIEDYDVFLEDETSEEEHDDAYYLGEEGDLAEEDFAEEENVDHVESRILAANEKYQSARDSVIERLTAILEKGEISAEDNAELSDAMHEYTDSVNDMKDKLNEDKQGNNDTNEINQGSTVTVLPEELQHLIDLMNNGGRNDLLFVDEEGRVLVEGEQVPKLKLIELEVEKLVADYAEIEDLVAKKATIEDLNVVKAQIGTLNVGEVIADIIHANVTNIRDLTADIGKIETLVGKNLTMENIASLILTSKKVTVEDAFIKDAMIDSVSAAKINTGILNTNLVNIQSEDGSLVLNGTLQQFKDQNGKVRIQMGKDAQGNFTFGLFDSTGIGTLIDSNGITEKAIGDGLIVDKMVGDNANISGSKLDIDSVITEVNNGTSTIKGSKVKLDEKNQTLEVAFSSMDTAVTEQGKAIGSHTTSIETMQGQISTLITDTEILEDGNKVTVKDAYNKLTLKVGEFGVSLKDIQSDFNSMVIGGRNLILDSDFKTLNTEVYSFRNNYCTLSIDSVDSYNGKNSLKIVTKVAGASGTDLQFKIKKEIGAIGDYIVSFYAKSSIANNKFYFRYGYGDFAPPVTLGTEWKKYEIILPSKTKHNDSLHPYLSLVGTVNIALFKVEKGNKPTDWTPAPEDTDSALTSIDTRVKSAETKLTLDGLKTIIGSTYTTSIEVDGKITSKGYATTSDVTQATNKWTASFTESGGYNILKNSTGLSGTKYWYDLRLDLVGSDLTSTFKSRKDSWTNNEQALELTIKNLTSGAYCARQAFDTVIGKQYIFTCYLAGHRSDKRVVIRGTTADEVGWLESKTFGHLGGGANLNDWAKVEIPFIAQRTKTIVEFAITKTPTPEGYLWAKQAMITEGKLWKPWSPHPSEIYDGIVTIDKDGLTVEASNAKSKTTMNADGFKITKTDANEDVFKVNADGTLTFKGDIKGSTFSSIDGGFKVKEDNEVEADSIVANRISTEILSVNEISNPQYPKSMEGSIQVYIDPGIATPSEVFEDGGTYKSFADLEELAPRNLNGYWLQVRLMSDITENVVYDTFFNGTLAVELNGKTLKGYIRFIGRTLSARLYGNIIGNTKGIMGSIMPNAGCNRLGYRYCVVAEMCDLVVYDIKAYKSVVTDINSGCFLYTDRASGYVSNVVPINEPYLMLRAHSMSNVYLESSNGMTSDFPIHSVSGAIITVNATKQAGRKGSTNHIWRANNGQVFADGVTWDTTAQSGNNNSSGADKVTKTVTVKATLGDTYRSTYTSWKKDGTVRQGNAYGSGNCDGCWFFGSSLSTYLAKNPSKVTIKITRQSGGSSAAVNLTMVGHNHTSRPSGAPNMQSAIRTFSLGLNASTTLTLTSAEITNLKKYKGIGLKTAYNSSNYAVCSATCEIKITYTE